jgi:Uncharacterized protein conserved in bacteria (DUF2213)
MTITTERVQDRGLIREFRKTGEGYIIGGMRIARVNVAMVYTNQDGSIRREIPTEEALFGEASADSLKMTVITHGHTTGDTPNPANFKEVAVGAIGSHVFREVTEAGVFCTVPFAIYDKETIYRLENGGSLGDSPGYHRAIAKIADGLYHQTDRRYYEVAVDVEPRGGPHIKIIDSSDPVVWYPDPAQFDENWHRAWTRDSNEETQAKIDRFLTHGSLSPPAIQLPSPTTIPKKKMAKIKIGNVALEVAEDSIQDAIQVSTSYTALEKATTATQDSANKAAELSGQIIALKAENAQLKADAEASVKDSAAQLSIAVQELARCNDHLVVMQSQGRYRLDDAAIKLRNHDVDGYKKAVVAASTNNDSAAIAAYIPYYDGITNYLPPRTDDMEMTLGMVPAGGNRAGMMMPAEMYGAGGLATAQHSYNDLINGANGGLAPGARFLVPENVGWEAVGA